MSRRNNSGSDFMANAMAAGFCFGIYGLFHLVTFIAKMLLIGGALKGYNLEKNGNNKEG